MNRPAPPHIQNILNRLQGVRQTADTEWEARCPAHDDQRASLSVGIGAEERGLIKCHAGCHMLTVLRAISLSLSDLYPQGHPGRERLAGRRRSGRIVATYDYRDAEGAMLFQVVRFDPKDFRQRRPDGNDGWTWGIEGIPRVLFRLPELLVANPADWVYVAEGEKDVLALVAAGLVATCNPGGAGKWDKLADDAALAGHRVCIVADADGPGRAHAADVAARLYGRAADVRTLELTGAKDPAAWLAAGGTAARLAELCEAAPTWTPGHESQRARIVQSNEHLRDLTDACVAALQAANEPPVTFVRCGELVRIAADENGAPRIEPYDKPRLRGRLCEVADFYALRKVGEEWVEVIADPRVSVVENVLTRGAWELPALANITRAPILRPDGSISTVPGYDPETRLYYQPEPGLTLGEIPTMPSVHDVDASMDKLLTVIADFPFADDASRANALAILFTLLMRSIIRGNVPLAIVDAPVQGTGKSLLVMALASIAIGAVCGESIPTDRNEDEWRKKITSILLRGSPFVLLDNVPDGTAVDSPALAAVLTSHEWSDRKLGSNESLVLPARAVWAATGNNLRIEGDMPRRCYLIRLDADTEQPWTRTGFTIADLDRHVHEHRAELLAAAFTVIRGWYHADCPQAAVPRLGGFDGWAQTVGSVLAYAGVEGFLGNLEQVVQNRDEESRQWAQFFEAWFYEFGDRLVTTDDVCSRLCGTETQHEVALPDVLLVNRDRGPGSLRRSLGRQLGKLTGRIYGGRKLCNGGDDSRKRVRMWCLTSNNCEDMRGHCEDIFSNVLAP